jgi:hypothetical protein
MIVSKTQIRYPGETDNHFRQRCHRRYSNCAEAYYLFSFSWHVFGHLTFAQVEISRRKRLSMLYAAIRSTFAAHDLKFEAAIWVWCEEIGKFRKAVPHIHFLIAAIPTHIDLEQFCHRLATEWRRVGGGLHKITRYNPVLDGAGYVAKCASNGETCGLTFSPAALRRLRRMAGRGTV